MEQNHPTKRLVHCLLLLKSKRGVSFYQMSKDTGYLPQTINKLTKGLQNAPIEMIEKFRTFYKLNNDFLFSDHHLPFEGAQYSPE